MDRFRAKASKASQAQSKLKQIDRMEKDRSAGRARKNGAFPFSATAAQRTSRHHVEGCRSRLRRSCCLSRTEFRGGTRATHRAGWSERRGQIDAAENSRRPLPVQSGERELGHNVKVGYFSQHRVDMFDARQTVLETARDMPNPVSEQTARTVLGSFLFRGDDVFKTDRRVKRRRKDAPRSREVIARSAESASDGRTDNTSRCRQYRCTARRALTIRGHADFHQSRCLLHPRHRQVGAAYQRRKTDALCRRLRLLSG